MTTFYDELDRLGNTDFAGFLARCGQANVSRALSRGEPQLQDFLALLSPQAGLQMEDLAQVAHRRTIKDFGRTMLLFTPLYLSNHCVNHCLYCAFNATSTIERRKLGLEEVEAEAKAIAGTDLEHILILTGESREHSPVSYIRDCVTILRRYFSSVSIEVYPLSIEEYRELIAAGVDGLTIYQEVYDRETYSRLHPRGPKRDYRYRLEAPERAAVAGMRTVNVGPLLGLGEWRSEVFFAGAHAHYLQSKFPELEVSISCPRMRPYHGGAMPWTSVLDRDLVQSILALRIFLPRAGITISTRESPELRDHLVGLGATRMSAGSSTVVGGHTPHAEEGVGQFDIADHRSVAEMRKALSRLGYKPVLKDWHPLGPAGAGSPTCTLPANAGGA